MPPDRALLHALCGGALIAVAGGAFTFAAAQEKTVVVTVTGSAEQSCSLGQPEPDGGAQSNFDAPSGSIFSISVLGDPVTLSTRAASLTLEMEASCNSAHRVLLASDGNGLWRNGVTTPVAGFGSAVPYRASLLWADSEESLIAEAAQRRNVERELLVSGPSAGQMRLEFAIAAGDTNAGTGAPLLAGEYSDVLRVTLESQ
ncbi:MAG: hypothetical protein IT546_07990 [Caulobacteraceae bacterium]|nr:hypothetical protein [Caulobacteraceae bacterium]